MVAANRCCNLATHQKKFCALRYNQLEHLLIGFERVTFHDSMQKVRALGARNRLAENKVPGGEGGGTRRGGGEREGEAASDGRER